MIASLYQSGSPTASLPIADMPVTFAAQIAPHNHWVLGRTHCGWPAKANGSSHVEVTAAVRMHALAARKIIIVYGNFIIWLATHCHRPPRSTQVSVKRNFRSNGLP